jgi:hypothetical protein
MMMCERAPARVHVSGGNGQNVSCHCRCDAAA